jgi:hypothetical protein
MKQYLFNLAWAVDAFVSTVLGGMPDDTISERLGRADLAKASFSWWHRAVITSSQNLVNWLAYVVTAGKQHNHCEESLLGKTNCKEIWSWGGGRSPKEM